MSALEWDFCHLRMLARKLASTFGHPTQVSLQVQLLSTTCESGWLGINFREVFSYLRISSFQFVTKSTATVLLSQEIVFRQALVVQNSRLPRGRPGLIPGQCKFSLCLYFILVYQ